MIKVNFNLILQVLTLEIKAKRMKMAKELFQFLINASEHKLDIILIHDESWYYLMNQRNSTWFEASQFLPKKVKQTIGFKKVIILEIWCRKGIVSITMLPPGEKFNKQFFSENVLGDLAQNLNTKCY